MSWFQLLNKRNIRSILKIHRLSNNQFGIDRRRFSRALRGIPRYFRDLINFSKTYRGMLSIAPCLHDWNEEGGQTRSEYFWQDLLVAKKIFDAKPDRHVDIGSRVDGFVAHVASFRKIEVLDIRPIKTRIPGVSFIQADLMRSAKEIVGHCDSLSCLHALEHFGLGRYGDKIDPAGFERGLVNMSDLLKENGRFYLSVPIGIDRVEFNAHRVFDPRIIVNLAARCSLRLTDLTVVHSDGILEDCSRDVDNLSELASRQYVLGIFTFEKRTEV